MNAQDLTPREIVAELDRYVVGQAAAKRAVALALRNRWRRQRVGADLREEILPKNIILIGPTGVGKTEIARRLARLAGAPFVKVEASKFTEVGYVGRDVDSMVRDLVEAAVKLVKEEEMEKLRDRAREAAEEKVLDALGHGGLGLGFRGVAARVRGEGDADRTAPGGTREKARAQLRAGTLDDETVEVEVAERAAPVMPFMGPGMEDMAQGLQDMVQGMGNNPLLSHARRRAEEAEAHACRVKEALELLTQEEAARMVDMERVIREALERAQSAGIIFIDEIDKIAGGDGGGVRGPDVSRGGVQRDLLPIVEGSNVNTKYGTVKTDHMLFIAAGAFHVAKVSDLIPELQGRFPIRVELEPLTREDLVRILKEPRNSLVRQYTALLATEGVDVQFRDDAIEEMARIAAEVNERMENIGARRLHTVMERLLDPISFDADELRGQRIVIDAPTVRERLQGDRPGRGPLEVHSVALPRSGPTPMLVMPGPGPDISASHGRQRALGRAGQEGPHPELPAAAAGAGSRARARASSTRTATPTSTSSAAWRWTCSGTATRRWSAPSRSRRATVWHVSNHFYIPRADRARRGAAGGDPLRARAPSSATAARRPTRRMLKLARKYYADQGHPERHEIVACHDSFHGRTLFTVTVGGQEKYRQGFEPVVPGVRHVPFGDVAALEAALTDRTAAFVVEPIQGEAGVVPAPEGYLRRGARARPTQRGALLCLDEIQTGMGRTGQDVGARVGRRQRPTS